MFYIEREDCAAMGGSSLWGAYPLQPSLPKPAYTPAVSRVWFGGHFLWEVLQVPLHWKPLVNAYCGSMFVGSGARSRSALHNFWTQSKRKRGRPLKN